MPLLAILIAVNTVANPWVWFDLSKSWWEHNTIRLCYFRQLSVRDTKHKRKGCTRTKFKWNYRNSYYSTRCSWHNWHKSPVGVLCLTQILFSGKRYKLLTTCCGLLNFRTRKLGLNQIRTVSANPEDHVQPWNGQLVLEQNKVSLDEFILPPVAVLDKDCSSKDK